MVVGWRIAFYTLDFLHLDFLTPDFNPESIFLMGELVAIGDCRSMQRLLSGKAELF